MGEKLKRAKTGALAGTALCWLLACAVAYGNHNTTDLISIGPNGGNGAFSSQFRGASADGSKVFFQTNEQLVAADTDARMDIYQRSGGTTTLLTTGATGGNGAFNASFAANSQDGSRVFFRTTESLVAADTDTAQDIYERSGGVTSLVSTGPAGNGSSAVIFDAISADGSVVFFDSADQLVAGDTDTWTDVYKRAGGTTTLMSPGGGAGDALFAGAPSDGSRVFFRSDVSFAATDFDIAQDIYESNGTTVTHLSIGPAGGNGNLDFDYDAFFDGTSADGSKVWLHTDEALVFGDTDTANDVYERSGGGISLVSTGPTGGNGEVGAFYNGSSADGSRVFFDTQEPLTAGDTDGSTDIYERVGGATNLISTGPAGGNGTFFSSFQAASTDGTKVFFHTADPLVTSDTDGQQDVYMREGSTTTLISTGPNGGNGAFPATFRGMSKNGSRVFFDTSEHLVSFATGVFQDLYEREADVTTFISRGPTGGNGDFPVLYDGASDDGSRVFYDTAEALVAGDTDTFQDVYMTSITDPGGYARPKGATPMRVPLVPAYDGCTASNRVHGPGLAFPSCNPPVQTSPNLTVGSPDANATSANFVGSVKLDAIVGIASTPADEADVKLTISMTDVRLRSDLSDYTGQVQVVIGTRVTDKLNGLSPLDTGTVQDAPFPVTVPCTSTASTTIGSTCSLTTTADAVVPGTVREIKRTMWQLDKISVMDGGPDGVIATDDNSLFATQGLFVP